MRHQSVIQRWEFIISSLDHSLIYVSRKTIAADDEESVALFIPASRVRNESLGVTGTLVSAGAYFAQILEGSLAALDELMDSILRDSRHTDVSVLRTVPIARRSFDGWALSYSGPSMYLSSRIGRLIGVQAGETDVRVDRLIIMMTGLGTNDPVED